MDPLMFTNYELELLLKDWLLSVNTMIVFLKREHNIHLMEMQSTESKKFKYKHSQINK